MIVFQVLLSAIVQTTVIIATLRAGSRAKYLWENGEIGMKDGPTLGNESASLSDVARTFRESVRVGLNLSTDRDFVIVNEKEWTARCPYSLSPFPNRHLLVDDVNATARPNYGRLEEGNTSVAVSSVGDELIVHEVIEEKEMSRDLQKVAEQNPILKQQDGQNGTSQGTDEQPVETESESVYMSFTSSDGVSNRVTKIVAYAPRVFSELRSTFKVSEESFRQSILDSGPFLSFQSNSKGAARVGGVFFFTRDGGYMIKTIKKDEAKTFLNILPKYCSYMKQHSSSTLLTRFFGFYRIQMKTKGVEGDDEDYYIVIMNAVFPGPADKFIAYRYDLKGSTIGRQCSTEEMLKKGSKAVLKDLDLTREVESTKLNQGPACQNFGINIGSSAKSMLLAQLQKDSQFLAECNVMDYSLLVGIVAMDRTGANGASLLEAPIMKKAHQETTEDIENDDDSKGNRISMPNPFAKTGFLPPRVVSAMESTLSSVLEGPLPYYYGAWKTVVDGGALSVMWGYWRGHRALYYMGTIDFLQPWTQRKVLEREMKGLLGYDKSAISCAHPREYAARFLDYLDAHIS